MKVGPAGVFLGCFDPFGRRDGSETARLLTRAMGEPALVSSAGSLTVAVSDPKGEPSRPLLVVDGAIRPAGAQPSEDIYDLVTAEGLWQAYEHQGEQALERIRGEFALLIYDADRRRGLLARDPLGLRPVFLAESGGCLLFATEIRPLMEALPSRPAPDRVAFAHWLGFADMRDSRTLYEGIRRLPPGHAVLLDSEGWSKRRFWHWCYEEHSSSPAQELGRCLVEEMRCATAMSMAGAQAPALLLSGGLDSSAVLSCAAVLRPGALRTYSAVFPNHQEVDEAELIELQRTAHEVAGRDLQVRGGSVLGGTLEYLREWQVPDISSNHFFFGPLLQGIAADGSDVLIDGEGGDELFATAYYLLADRLRSGHLGGLLRLVHELPGIPTRAARARLLLRFGVLGALPGAAPHRLRARLDDWEAPPSYLTAAGRRAIEEHADPGAWKRRPGPRWWSFAVETLTSGGETIGAPEHLLRLARASGLVRRHPLLDLDLTLFMLRFPPELTFHPALTRPHLRGAFGGLVPDEVRLRPRKSYFDALRTESMLGVDLPVLRELLLAPSALIREHVRPEVLRELLEHPPHSVEAPRWSAEVLRLATGECWLQEQLQAGFAESMLLRLSSARARLTWSDSGS